MLLGCWGGVVLVGFVVGVWNFEHDQYHLLENYSSKCDYHCRVGLWIGCLFAEKAE